MFKNEFSFLPSHKNSHLFLAQYTPVLGSDSSAQEAVIFIPPFGEEMNRSKRMYVLCARLLAAKGITSFCFDLSGTGDSDGEWGDFDYDDWLINLKDVIDYVQQESFQSISLISLRFGALLALDAIAEFDFPINKCVFWDPVDNGEVYMRQLVRMKIAASMAEQLKKITTKDVLEELDSNGFVEIGGYKISNAIYSRSCQLKLANNLDQAFNKSEVHWMQTGKVEGRAKKTLPMTIKDEWVNSIVYHDVDDVRFWMQQETTISPQLLKQTQLVINS